MSQPHRTVRIVVTAGSLLSGLFIAPALHAAQLQNDGWQSLQPARAGQAVIDRTLLAANAPRRLPVPVFRLRRQSARPPAVAVAGEIYRLVKGEPLQQQLQKWAARAGWTVVWNVPDGWIVPGDKDYGGDFELAVKRVVEELANNGADVVGDSWRGNRTVIISQNGIVQ
ncbi:toxin co-regulated pilus biosynthesis Q family protein [Cupriavidus nantongensis]|uniref:toxin co-regulated pilus biosynthesis Q family protein n=1 Tax=Cupriavidus nantongensis TaxID=1796606 RepID=UPI00358FC1D0